MTKITDAQRRLLAGLAANGGRGMFDRYVRVVACSEVLTKFGSPVALTAFRKGWIVMDDDDVLITRAGRKRLAEVEKGDG